MKPTDYSNDAWKLQDDLRRQFIKDWDFRSDLYVTADGLERRIKIDNVEHNVCTIREFIAVLGAACDFVESSNPGWASHVTRNTSPPSAFEVHVE